MLGEGYRRGRGTVTGTEARDIRNSALDPHLENKFSCFLGAFHKQNFQTTSRTTPTPF